MASIKRSLSTKVNQYGKAEILLRLSLDKNNKQRIKSGIFINSERFRDGKIIKPRANRKEAEELTRSENDLIEFERFLITLAEETSSEDLTKEFIKNAIDRYRHPEKYEDTIRLTPFFDIFNIFIESAEFSHFRVKQFKGLAIILERFERYKKMRTPAFKLDLQTLDSEILKDFTDYLKNEYEIYKQFPNLFTTPPTHTTLTRLPKDPTPRGRNTIDAKLRLLRAFINWAIRKGFTSNNPFSNFDMTGASYGTPFYLTLDERDQISEFDFSSRPSLGVQRDIFIFQCLIGCRVSDLLKLTRDSIVNGAVEYIPSKTKEERPEVVRVPLNPQALELVKRYDAKPGMPLFPFITAQKYNDAIKEAIRLSGVDRVVTVLNPTTGKEEKRPIYEVASSHMARRTFIGNLYKKVKDPNLVGSLSGHKEGSRAFARYREIDDEIKKELINLL